MTKNIAKSKSSRYQKKIEELFQLYRTEGFDMSVDEMAEKLHITRKTFFNRYTSKDHSVKLSFDVLSQKVRNHFQERMEDCNNAVEALVVFMWEFKTFKYESGHFYEYAISNQLLMMPAAPFRVLLIHILQDGIRHYQVNEKLDVQGYAEFYLFNLFYYFDDHELTKERIRFLLSGALNERGMELLEFVLDSVEE